MCGICGLFGFGSEADLEQMSTCQTHRGPNSSDNHIDDNIRLSNQRLRIIDVEGGDQPIYNENGDVVVVYNGEIYNFQSLRSTLRDAGHTFTTETDTEVLVHGYEEWGTDLFERLNGMFAAAIYDASEKRLLLTRDRAGIKPLHYTVTDDGIAFASEPKAILKSQVKEPRVDTDALRYFLQLRYSPSETTLFEGIETLLPGTYLDCRLNDDGVTVDHERFWHLGCVSPDPPADPASALHSTLKRAVDHQLVSDVPVGFYLSGGLDTSSVVAMASDRREGPINTFCMGFADSEWDERAAAREVADHFGTVHHELTIDGGFMQDFPEMIWHADEPKRNLYPYYVAQEMADHVTVALGGLGADELFGGYVYRYHRLEDLQRLRSEQAKWLRERITETASSAVRQQLTDGDLEDDDSLEAYGALKHLDNRARLYVLLNSTDVIGDIEGYEQRLFGATLVDGKRPAKTIESQWNPDTEMSLPEQALRWDFTVKLPNDFLLIEDRMSMAHSLESRVPFLDNELIDLAFSISYDQKIGKESRQGDTPTRGKEILREAMSDALPKSVFERDKQGFTMPTYQFVRDELLPYARQILDNPHIVQRSFVDANYVDRLVSRTPTKDLTHHYKMLWKLVALEVWYQMYFVGDDIRPEPIDEYAT